MKKNISILIITYDRPAETLDLLKSIQKQAQVLEVVGEILLLNNASTKSYHPVKEFILKHPELPVNMIDSEQNLGVSGGRNYLISRAACPLLLVLDDDVIFAEENALTIASSLFDAPRYREKNTAVITLNIFYYSTGERQRTALPHKNYDEYRNKSSFFTYYFTGAAHLMKKELFDKTGNYPEDFFYGMEEYDLSYRIIREGYSLAYDDQIKIWHKESPLGRLPGKQKLAMMWYNKCVVAHRYLPQKYFYTTAIMWCLEYLKKSKGDVWGALKTLRAVFQIPAKIPSEKLDKPALKYLKKVKARLWY